MEPSTPRRSVPTPIIIDDDEDEAGAVRQRPAKRPRSSQALFLADSDDEQPPGPPPAPAATSSTRTDIDAMFQDIEDEDESSLAFQPLAPDLDLDAIRRAASAKHARSNAGPSLTPHAVMSSSPPRDGDNNARGLGAKSGDKSKDDGKDGRKERKRKAKMDETRLLGESGFPALIKTTKGFVPKGKGHEVRFPALV